MTSTLKNNDFSGYRGYLDSWEIYYESEYQSWLDQLIAGGSAGAPLQLKGRRDQMLQRHSESAAKKRDHSRQTKTGPCLGPGSGNFTRCRRDGAWAAGRETGSLCRP